MTGEQHWAGARSDHTERHRRGRQPLARLLAEAGVASEQDLRLAVAEGMGTGERLGEVVIRRGWIDERQLAELVARQWQLPFVAEPQLPEEAARVLDADTANEHAVCPIDFEAAAPCLALAEPSDERIAAGAAAVDGDPHFAVVTPSSLLRLLDQLRNTQPRSNNGSSDANDDSVFEREADAVVAGIEAAALAVSDLRERLAARTDELQREVAVCRQELAELRQARAIDQETIDRLETELHAQRELHDRVRASLAELTKTLEHA
jgi:hypothetical protein